MVLCGLARFQAFATAEPVASHILDLAVVRHSSGAKPPAFGHTVLVLVPRTSAPCAILRLSAPDEHRMNLN
jgi:hypothetical protein